MTVIRMVARPLLSSMFLVGGFDALRNPKSKVDKAAPVTDKATELLNKAAPNAPVPTDAATLVRINGAAMVLAGAALATGRYPRAAGLTLAATLVPTTVAGHRFWEESDPGARKNQQIHFFKNLSMMGGALLASVDTAGKPGLAWRARHGVKDARRQSRQLRKQARLQAKAAMH